MTRLRLHVVVAIAAVVCCAPGLIGCRVFASKADYADYRSVRLARGDSDKLAAMRAYVAKHPDGAWHAEIARARAERDLATFEAGKTTRRGLERYLAVFPDGMYAAQARSRLSAIDLLDQRKREAVAREATLAAERRAHEDELRRTWVSRFIGYWANTFVGLAGWGEPIADVARANAAFSRAFGAEPRPRCTASECVKYYSGRFGVPVPGGTRIERTVSLLLRLKLQDGKLTRAELLLPERGLSRMYELEQRSLVVDSDPDSRKLASDWALARIASSLPDLEAKATLEADFVLAPIDKPALGPNGEQTDTAAEDPSVPPNRLSQPDAAQTPSVEQLVAPSQEPAADMVFSPMAVDRSGRTQTAPDMLMAPVAVPDTPAAESPAVQAAPAAVIPTSVRAYRVGELRIVIFAAGSDSAAPFDGVFIERVTAAPPKQPVRPARH